MAAAGPKSPSLAAVINAVLRAAAGGNDQTPKSPSSAAVIKLFSPLLLLHCCISLFSIYLLLSLSPSPYLFLLGSFKQLKEMVHSRISTERMVPSRDDDGAPDVEPLSPGGRRESRDHSEQRPLDAWTAELCFFWIRTTKGIHRRSLFLGCLRAAAWLYFVCLNSWEKHKDEGVTNSLTIPLAPKRELLQGWAIYNCRVDSGFLTNLLTT